MKSEALVSLIRWGLVAGLAGCFPGPLAQGDADAGDVGEVATAGDAATTSATGADGDATGPGDGEVDGVGPGCDDDGDCDALDGACAEGRCASGRCEAEPRTGGTCDDGQACTRDDTCDAGACAGTPVVCQALDACHEAGTCDPGTGLCSNPAKDDDTPCDDGDVCTWGDRCTSGFCVGPSAPPLEDYSLAIEAVGDAVATQVARAEPGAVAAWFTAQATELRVDNDLVFQTLEPRCGLYFVEADAGGKVQRVVPFTAKDACVGIFGVYASAGFHAVQDGSFIAGVTFDEPIVTSSGGETLGVSPTGLLLEQGHLIMRLDAALTPVWVVSFLGFDDDVADGYGRPRFETNAANESILTINAGRRGDLREVVGADGTSSVFELDGNNRLALVYRLRPFGEHEELARLQGGLDTEVAFVAPEFAPDGHVVLTGFITGATSELTTASDTVSLPTLGGATDGFALALDADAAVAWWRHFFVPPAAGVANAERQVLPTTLAADGEALWLAIRSARAVSSRSDDGVGVPLTPDDGLLAGGVTIVRLSARTGAVEYAVSLGAAETHVSRIVPNVTGVQLVGTSRDLVLGEVAVGVGGTLRPFVMQESRWLSPFAAATAMPEPAVEILQPFGDFLPAADADGTGGILVAGAVVADVFLGIRAISGVQVFGEGTSAGYVARLGGNAYLSCP